MDHGPDLPVFPLVDGDLQLRHLSADLVSVRLKRVYLRLSHGEGRKHKRRRYQRRQSGGENSSAF